jgi:hypothetical protein
LTILKKKGEKQMKKEFKLYGIIAILAALFTIGAYYPTDTVGVDDAGDCNQYIRNLQQIVFAYSADPAILLNSLQAYTGDSITFDSQIKGADSATIPPLNLTERSTAPTSPASGDIYLDDGTNTASTNPGWRRYTGAVWEDIGIGTGTGDVVGPSGGTAQYMIAIYASTTGKLLQASSFYTDASGNFNLPSGAKYKINGTDLAADDILPTQTGNSGKVLGTDGANSSWVVAGTGNMNTSAYDPAGYASQVLTEADTQNVSNKILVLPKFLDSGEDNYYIISVADITANRTISFPLLTGNDTFVFRDFPQTLLYKTLTAPTLTSPVLDTSLSGTAFLDEDTMASNAADKAASQQSIKAYVTTSLNMYLPLAGGVLTNTLTTDDVEVPYGEQLQFRSFGGYLNYFTSNATGVSFVPEENGNLTIYSKNGLGVTTIEAVFDEDGLTLQTGASVDTIEATLTDDGTHLPNSAAVYAKTVVSNTIEDATAADQTHTMPILSASIDGYTYRVGKYGQYKETIQPGNTTDSIADSGDGYGIETLDGGQAFVTLLADNTNKKWHIVDNTGRWAVEGMEIHIPFNKALQLAPANATYMPIDELVNSNETYTVNTCNISTSGDIFTGQTGSTPTIFFDGTDGYAKITGNVPNAHVYGSLTDDWTLSVMVKFDDATPTNYEYIVAHYQSTTYRWNLVRNITTGELLVTAFSGTQILNITSTNTILDTNWHQIDIVKVNADVAVYIDKTYGGKETITSTLSASGALYFAQFGGDQYYLDGSLSDFFLVNQNLYNADPSTTADLATSTQRIKPFGGIYE